jgi:hypothetical protein
LAALDALFRAGTVPSPQPDGLYHGEPVALDIAPIVTQFVEWLTSFAMPWKGKFLIAAESRGDNIFGAKWRTVLGLTFPFYKGNRDQHGRRFARSSSVRRFRREGRHRSPRVQDRL